MALVSNGCAVDIAASILPSDYTKPSVTEFTDYDYQVDNQVLTIAKSTVENADAATTFTALVAAIVTALDTQMGADFDDTLKTITYFSKLKRVRTNANLEGVLYTSGVVNYLCTVDIFAKSA